MKPPARSLVTMALAAAWLATGCSEETFATVVSDASVADATSDASIADAGANVDARPFCEGLTPAPLFCADFDDGDPVQFGWNEIHVSPTGSGTLTVDTAESRSAPAALVARNQSTGGLGIQTWLGRALIAPPSVNGVTLDYDLFIEDIAQAADVKVAMLIFDEPSVPGDYALQFSVSPTGCALEERMPPLDGGTNGPYVVTSGVRFVLPSKWTHVTTALDFSKPTATVKIDLDGQSAIEERPLTPGYLRQLMNLQVGMTYADNVKGPIAVRLDNVVLRVVP
jgi:hypothetical protein